MAIAQMVGIQDVKPGEVKEHFKTYFSQIDTKWLLIFDNADEMEMWIKGSNNSPPLKDFLPFNNQGHIVFTTRNRKLAVKLASSDVISVHELDEKTGVEFLERSLIQNSLINNHHAVITLLKQLTFLPLAITQAAAYINENGIAVSDYLLLLQEQETDVMELLSKDFGDDGRYKDIQNPVAKTWLVSFSQVQKLDQLAAEYLSLMACVDPRNIPQTFLPQPGSKVKMTDALGLLSAYSFITIQPGNCFITLHRLVYLATRNWMRKEEQFPAYIKKAADRLNKTFPTNEHTNRQLWREYLPHALSLISEREFQEQQEQYIDYMQNVGTCLDSDGRYNEAEKLLVQVMGTWKQVLGPEHPSTLTSMANLASTYRNQGQWRTVEELLVQVINIRKRALGLKHPNTITSMENLLSIYQDQGRWKTAHELAMLVNDIRPRVPDPEDPYTLLRITHDTSTDADQGQWVWQFVTGEELLEQVINIHKRVLGLEHPKTLTSMDSLTSFYRDHGQWKMEEELAVQVLDIRKRQLGLEHPDTLTSMSNLALTYAGQEQWKKAEELEVQAMEMRKQILGSEHPDTLTSMHNLAYTCYSQKNIHDAFLLMGKCVRLRESVLGPSHPGTIKSARFIMEWERTGFLSTNQKSQCSVQAKNDRSIGEILQESRSLAAVIVEADSKQELISSQQGYIRPGAPLQRFLETHPLKASRGSSVMQGYDLHEVD